MRRPLQMLSTSLLALLSWAGAADAQTQPGCPPEYPAPVPQWPGSLDTTRSWEREGETDAGRFAGFMGWSVNTPIGDMRSFTSNVSPVGFELQFRVFVAQQLALGVSGEWASFSDERERATYNAGTVDITASADNEVQLATWRVGSYYYLVERGSFLPYVGLHVGVGWVGFQADITDRSFVENEASVAFGGDLGAEIPLGVSAPIVLLHLRYSALPNAEFRSVVGDVQTLAAMVGVGF